MYAESNVTSGYTTRDPHRINSPQICPYTIVLPGTRVSLLRT